MQSVGSCVWEPEIANLLTGEAAAALSAQHCLLSPAPAKSSDASGRDEAKTQAASVDFSIEAQLETETAAWTIQIATFSILCHSNKWWMRRCKLSDLRSGLRPKCLALAAFFSPNCWKATALASIERIVTRKAL